jgi:hypothetical protein
MAAEPCRVDAHCAGAARSAHCLRHLTSDICLLTSGRDAPAAAGVLRCSGDVACRSPRRSDI